MFLQWQMFAGTTKYLNPIRCGGASNLCDYGSTCSPDKSCVCEIDCLKYGKLQQPVCGSDGNTYRSECQLRQYSCRIQKEIIIVNRSPCKGEPWVSIKNEITLNECLMKALECY